MLRSRAKLLLQLGTLCLATHTAAFKYEINDKYVETGKWSFTETYMYGTHKVGHTHETLVWSFTAELCSIVWFTVSSNVRTGSNAVEKRRCQDRS